MRTTSISFVLLLVGSLFFCSTQATLALAEPAEQLTSRAKLLPLKECCRKSVHCESGYCGRGKCRNKKPIGHVCYKNLGCKSGHCVSSKCVKSSSASTKTTTSSQSTKTSPTTYSFAQGTGVTSSASELLKLHNEKRALHQAPALTWSSKLENYAAAWGSRCNFEHSKGSYGENIAYGAPASSFTDAKLFDMWYDEGNDYDYSRTDFSEADGHFTQVVWKSTTQVGCADIICDGGSLGGGKDDGSKARFLVCEYSPPGNVGGGYTTNVLPLSS